MSGKAIRQFRNDKKALKGRVNGEIIQESETKNLQREREQLIEKVQQ